MSEIRSQTRRAAHGAVAGAARAAFYFGFIAIGVMRALHDRPQRCNKANRTLTWQLWLFAAGSFAFGFALVPLYNVLCDVTGYGDRSKLQRSGERRRSAG